MKTNEEIKDIAIETIKTEAAAILNLKEYIDDDFSSAVKAVYQSEGRLIITGIGKSANIAQKIVATLNSTGTPSIFMHAADAIHGDLGIIQEHDVVLCISKSGNTPEVKVLVPLIKNFGNTLIGMTSNTESFLAQKADLVLKAYVPKEACPNNLAPTSSTTAQLVMGDALAVALLELRGFNSKDFAKFHPGGALGKKLYLTVDDVTNYDPPKVKHDENIRNTILEMTSKRLGATAVLDDKDNVIGIVTDGDLRRMIQNNNKVDTLTAKDIMSHNPKTIASNELAINAFNLMEEHNITQVIVIDNSRYVGMVHLHDIIKEGIV